MYNVNLYIIKCSGIHRMQLYLLFDDKLNRHLRV